MDLNMRPYKHYSRLTPKLLAGARLPVTVFRRPVWGRTRRLECFASGRSDCAGDVLVSSRL